MIDEVEIKKYTFCHFSKLTETQTTVGSLMKWWIFKAVVNRNGGFTKYLHKSIGFGYFPSLGFGFELHSGSHLCQYMDKKN